MFQNNHLNVLKNIAGVVSEVDNNEVAREEYSQSFINKSEEFLETNKNLDPDLLFQRWEKEVGNSWDLTTSNKEYYYSTLEAINPLGPQATRDKILKDIISEITLELTPQEREWKMQSLARTLPNYAWDNLGFLEQLTKEKGIIDGQFTETSRIGTILNTKHGLVDKDFSGLDVDKTSQAHTEDYLKGLRLGYGEEIKVMQGQFSVPLDGQYTPLSIVPEQKDVDIRQTIMEIKDLKPIISKRVSSAHRASQVKAIKEREETQKMIFDNIKQLPREFHTNVIRDYALTQENSGEVTYSSIESLVRAEKDSTALDKIASFRAYFSELFSRTRRMIDDSTGT
jgi:hypothetical protein